MNEQPGDLNGLTRSSESEFAMLCRALAEREQGFNGRLKSVQEKMLALAARLKREITKERAENEGGYTSVIRERWSKTERRPPALPLGKGRRTLYYYVDHTVRCASNTGMQRVTRSLAAGLLASGEKVAFVKWDDRREELVLISQKDMEYLGRWNGPRPSEAVKALYPARGEDGSIVASHEIGEGCWLIVPEVTHITFHPEAVTLKLFAAARRKGLRTVFVYYDAIPLRRAEHAPQAQAHEIYTQQLLLADLIVPISRWVARDIVSFFLEHDNASLTPTPRVTPILNPAGCQMTPRVGRSFEAGFSDQLILSVGSIEARKNQLALVRSFERFCELNPTTAWQLFLAGNLHPDAAPEIARATERNPRIRYLQPVSDDELDTLYRRCAFTVFPSVEEGLGLPILESLWYAKPCICANFGAMDEVAKGGGCIRVNTRDEQEIFKAVKSLIESPGLIDRLSREASERHLSDWSDYVATLTKEMDAVVMPIADLGPVYYWVDHTCTYPHNSGIQRVVRGLGRALIELGLELIPVKWDGSSRRLTQPSAVELKHLSRWNGPSIGGWSKWKDPSQRPGWLLVPELTTYLPEPDVPGLRELTSSAGLRCAWIFHDAIPWKLQGMYPREATRAHEIYMAGLNRHDLVLANSAFTREDLLRYLGQQSHRSPGLFERIVACVLPGEFTETPRLRQASKPTIGPVRILCVGTIEPRKNHLVLLEAFSRVVATLDTPVELVLAGGSPFPELAEKVEGYCKRGLPVRWVKSPSDTELGRLYDECAFTVFPSLEEGFGIPILESLWHARPCVCASFGVMGELAQAGGCLTANVRNASELAEAIVKLITDTELREQLANEAVSRPFKSWKEYATEVALRMASERQKPLRQKLPSTLDRTRFYDEFVNLKPRPKLSVCITTYNRASWLEINLRNLARLWPESSGDVEFVVCDNASTDQTSEVVKPYLRRSDFRYVRNSKNVGMLGNLRVTANQAQGEYVWILGDDDLLRRGSIERVLGSIRSHERAALVYLNYSYTRVDDARSVVDLDGFLDESTPIVVPGSDLVGPVREICTQSENFFTAIYCLVFRRDHAIRAYTQNTEGRPFSTMSTCIPTTYYVLNHMMEEPACWIGEPMVVVNMNVSWMKYAPLWILERIPEVYDLAERLGADRAGVDRWRRNNLPGVVHFLKDIFDKDPEGNLEYFSMQRLVSRLKGLEGIETFIEDIRNIYQSANEAGHPAARVSAEEIFSGFGGAFERLAELHRSKILALNGE
jgi:glycosyltransferase involved in cell wall biosynthesis